MSCLSPTNSVRTPIVRCHSYTCRVVVVGSSFEEQIDADVSEQDHKPRSYLCTVCDKWFTTKWYLNAHSKLHSGQNLYSSSECEKSFPTLWCLKSHMNGHSNKYQCSECGKCYQSNHHLAEHRRSHSGEKPFVCTVCDKRFTRSSSLIVHSRIHSGENPYKCLECDKASRHFGDLYKHMTVHRGDKPYKCSLCSQMFSKSNSLRRHERTIIHGSTPGRGRPSHILPAECSSAQTSTSNSFVSVHMDNVKMPYYYVVNVSTVNKPL